MSSTTLARYISAIGHPLLTLPLFSTVALFKYEPVMRASALSLLILGGLFVPLALTMYRKQARGTYTNFDVSDQTQRKTWYILAVGLLACVTISLYVTNQNYLIRVSFLLATLLLATSQAVNYFIKSSLHVSLNSYLAFLLLIFDWQTGCLFLACIPLIGWSRVHLNRHTLPEVMMGVIIGSGFGSWLLYLVQ